MAFNPIFISDKIRSSKTRDGEIAADRSDAKGLTSASSNSDGPGSRNKITRQLIHTSESRHPCSGSGMAATAQSLSDLDAGLGHFSGDSLILTRNGPVPAQDLRVGQKVWTRDRSFQPIRWIGRYVITSSMLAADKKLCPIRIRKNALGWGIPSLDLIVSPQQRILLNSRITERMFEAPEILASVRHLCEAEGIDVATDVNQVTYVTFLLDRHHLVNANGAISESLYPDSVIIESIDDKSLTDIIKTEPPQPARLIPPERHIQKLVARHVSNHKALVC